MDCVIIANMTLMMAMTTRSSLIKSDLEPGNSSSPENLRQKWRSWLTTTSKNLINEDSGFEGRWSKFDHIFLSHFSLEWNRLLLKDAKLFFPMKCSDLKIQSKLKKEMKSLIET